MRPIPAIRILFVGAIVALGGFVLTPRSLANEPQSAEELLEQISIVDKGDSGRSVRKDAADEIPYAQLPAATRKEVERLVDSTDMFRRLPTLRFEVDPGVYSYFIAHPDVAVAIWNAMNVSQLKLQQASPVKFNVDGGDGTVGELQVLYRDGTHQLILCEGEFKSPIVKRTVKAKAIMHLVTSADRLRDGRIFITHRLDLFVSFPSQAFGTAAKLASPVSNMIIDRNFREVSLFVRMMALAMARQPDWVENLAGRLQGVPQEHKDELIKLTARVFLANQERLQSQREAGETPTAEAPAEMTPTVPAAPKVAAATESMSIMK